MIGIFVLIFIGLIVGVGSGVVFENSEEGLDENGFPLKHRVLEFRGKVGNFVEDLVKNIGEGNG